MTQSTEQERGELYLEVERSLMVRSLDEWVMETGVAGLNISWHSEVQSIVEMAFNKGAEIGAARSVQGVAQSVIDKIVPAIDPEGLCEEKHHCEWALYKDRERIRRELAAAPNPPETDCYDKGYEDATMEG